MTCGPFIFISPIFIWLFIVLFVFTMAVEVVFDSVVSISSVINILRVFLYDFMVFPPLFFFIFLFLGFI